MQTLTEELLEHGLADKVFTTNRLKNLIGGTNASIYGLVNKAIKKNEIISLRKGIYILNPKYSLNRIDTFYISSQLEPHSYISLETALSYHGWIPERVTVVGSIISHGRKKAFDTPLGTFEYSNLPTKDYGFLFGVHRATTDNKPFLIASAPRALLDMVYERKLEWQGIEFIVDSLRIDYEQLSSINLADYQVLNKVYKSERTLNFLQCLIKDIYGSNHTERKTR